MSHATFVSRNIYQLFGLYVNNKGLTLCINPSALSFPHK